MRRSKVSLEAIIIRVASLKAAMPASGMTAAAFEALALSDVPPPEVRRVLRSLHNRRAVFVRTNRGDVRVFARRPASIAGVFEATDAVDGLISCVAVHVRRISQGLAARDAAKAADDVVAANAARDQLDVCAQRLVALVVKRRTKGTALNEIQRALWSVFSPSVMKFVAGFEPALMQSSSADSVEARTVGKRIANGLDAVGKVQALVTKAGDQGLTKSDLYQSIRPKMRADRLGRILEALVREGTVDSREVRVRGSRFAIRFFAIT